MMPVETCPITTLAIVTAMSMRFIGLRSSWSASTQNDGGGSERIAFGPFAARRVIASAFVSPRSASDPISATTSSAPRA